LFKDRYIVCGGDQNFFSVFDLETYNCVYSEKMISMYAVINLDQNHFMIGKIKFFKKYF